MEMDVMTFRLEFVKLWATLATLVIFGACEKMPTDLSTANSGEIESTIAFKLTDEVVSELATMEILVTGADFLPIRQPLELDGNVARGKVLVEPGEDRLFTVYGYGVDGNLIYTGQTWSHVRESEALRVEITVQRVNLDEPRNWLEGVIKELASIYFSGGVDNWDADPENDGIKFRVFYRNRDTNGIYSWGTDGDVTVRLDLVAYHASELGSFERKYKEPLFVETRYLSSASTKILIPWEDLGEIGTQDLRGRYVDLIIEATITMSNGSKYQDFISTSYRYNE